MSETTFSPEEEHIHDQLKMMLQKEKEEIPESKSSLLEMFKVKETSKEKSSLPKIKESEVVEKKK